MISRIVVQWWCLGLLAFSPSAFSSECGTRTVEKNSIITSLIIDGDTANSGEFPWMAGILVNGRFRCAGNLVKDRYIITTADCVSYRRYYTNHVRRPEEVKVTLGSIRRTSADPDRITIRASKIFVESAYRRATFANDLAVITLASPVSISSKISPICLPTNCSHEDEGDEECYTPGWGRTISYFSSLPDYLLKARQRVYPMSRCVAAGYNDGYDDPISQICAESTRTTTRVCYGDGGGGLVCRSSSGKWVLRGIGSNMLGSCTSDFTIYTRVCHYLDDVLNIVDG